MAEQMQEEQEDVREVEATPVMGAGTIGAIVKAEIDVQISTAKAYPRSLSRFAKEVLDMATLNPEVAKACMYSLKRDGKTILGPSARLAEIALSAWGNSRGGARIVDDSGDFVTAQGFMHDLERNVAVSFEVRRRITTREGRRYSPDMIGVTANAAASIAFRNAVFKVIPRAYWAPAFDKALGVVRGDVKTLVTRRAAAMETVQKLGVTSDRVLATLGVEGIEDIGLDELVTLQGILNAIEEGDTSVDQAFVTAKKNGEPPAGAASPGMAGLNAAVGAGEPKGEEASAVVSGVSTSESPAPAPTPDPFALKFPTLARLQLSTDCSELDLVTAARTKAATIVDQSLSFDESQKWVTAQVNAAREEWKQVQKDKKAK